MQPFETLISLDCCLFVEVVIFIVFVIILFNLPWTSRINKAINLNFTQEGYITSALNLPSHFTFPLPSQKRPAMTHRGCSAVMLRF